MIIQNSRKTNDFKTCFYEKLLAQCTNCRYLGIIIDNNLNWKVHVKRCVIKSHQ